MDYKLHRPQPVCHRTGHGFACGEEFFSALVRGAGGLERLDIAVEAWDGPPPDTVAWWRSRRGLAPDSGPMLAPVDVLLDALEALGDDPAEAALRYLLALQLVRRRTLRIEGDAGERSGAPGTIVFSCRRRDRNYHVASVGPEELACPAVASRLTGLLWSGEAAA
jgi:hypothetical protein